jgi:phenylacetate-CoA ligase
MTNIMPLLRRNIFEKLYGLKSHSPKLPYWHELEKTQFYPEERLLDIQWQRLREILQFVWEHNDFYRRRFQEAGCTPADIRSVEDMKRLPILTKEEIRGSTTSMVSSGFSVENLMRAKTGGSTGKALDIYMTEECSELRNACARRSDRWTGWEVGEPIGACWGNPHLPVTLKEKLLGWLLSPFIYLDTMSVSDDSVRKFASEWQRVKPTLLFGHAHSIYLLARLIRELGIREIKPKGILSSSMMLMPHERKVIEEVFGVKVTDRYGCEEVSLFASECERHEGMHLNIEHLFIEFVKDDGSYALPGEPGRIIVTDLLNRAMPFIRYRVEDVGVPTDRKCSCGRGLPLMDSVTGRVADFLVKRDGTRVAGVSLIENTLTRIPGIDQMQIIQESFDLFTLNLVAGAGFEQDQEVELIEYFHGLFGKETKVHINRKNSIVPERSGKYRFSICKVGLD